MKTLKKPKEARKAPAMVAIGPSIVINKNIKG
jgi:hypothetical protein